MEWRVKERENKWRTVTDDSSNTSLLNERTNSTETRRRWNRTWPCVWMWRWRCASPLKFPFFFNPSPPLISPFPSPVSFFFLLLLFIFEIFYSFVAYQISWLFTFIQLAKLFFIWFINSVDMERSLRLNILGNSWFVFPKKRKKKKYASLQPQGVERRGELRSLLITVCVCVRHYVVVVVSSCYWIHHTYERKEKFAGKEKNIYSTQVYFNLCGG